MVHLHPGHLGAPEVGHLGYETGAGSLDVEGARDGADAEPRGQPAGDLSGVVGEAEEQEVGAAGLDQRLQGVSRRLGDVLIENLVVAGVHLLGAVLAELGGRRLGALAESDRFDVAEGAGLGEQLECDGGELSARELGVDPDLRH